MFIARGICENGWIRQISEITMSLGFYRIYSIYEVISGWIYIDRLSLAQVSSLPCLNFHTGKSYSNTGSVRGTCIKVLDILFQEVFGRKRFSLEGVKEAEQHVNYSSERTKPRKPQHTRFQMTYRAVFYYFVFQKEFNHLMVFILILDTGWKSDFKIFNNNKIHVRIRFKK